MRRTRISDLGRPMLLAALIGGSAAPGIAAAQMPLTPAAASGVPANGVGSAFELAFWQSVTGSADAASYEAYLAKYPEGTFSGLARAKIAVLQRALVMPPTAAPATTPALAPTAVPDGLAVPQAAPLLVPTPAVAMAATPTTAPGPTAPASQPAEMIPASAALATTDPSTPLARLLAQLRSNAEPTGAQAAVTAPVSAPLVSTAPPVQPALAANPGNGSAPVAALAPPGPQAAASAVGYASGRPVLLPVPEVALPAYFCSNEARNAFHNGSYRPAVEAATHNNEAAVGYLRQLQQTYERGQLGRDTAVLNAIAAEARAYQSEAARTYSAQAALVHQFDVLMAVPLRACPTGTQ